MFLDKLKEDKNIVYSTDYQSGNSRHVLYLKKALDDGSGLPKFYINALTMIKGKLVRQGFIYFYVDTVKRTSHFIGLGIEDEFRNLNIGNLLVAMWINFCFDNGLDFLGTNKKQRKPFLLYMLKKYGFDIPDVSLYDTSRDVISLYQNIDFDDKRKLLLFRDEKNGKKFSTMNIYKSDNYEIIRSSSGMIFLDRVIIPLEKVKDKEAVRYSLRDSELAKRKCSLVLDNHHI